MKRRIVNIFLCCALCGIALFAYSHRFVNAEVTPKWMGLLLVASVAGICWAIFSKKADNAVHFWRIHYICGIIIVFAAALAVHGLLQYFGVLRSTTVTGNFDNTAGFAAALVCALPLCFMFFRKDTLNYIRFSAIFAAAIMVAAVVLSSSRAGMMAIAAVTVVWALMQFDIKNQIAKTAIVFAIVALPLALYFLKKDSADGRLLIWQNTVTMFAEKPIFGHGHGAFQAKYMLYQAEYFAANPDSRYAQLAGNVLHPFNEYLLVLAQYGFTGFGVIVSGIFLLARAYRRNKNPEKLPAMLCLIAIAVFSMFSYPFKYPFTWIILCLSVAVISFGIENYKLKIENLKFIRIAVFFLSTILLSCTIVITRAQTEWKRIARLSLAGQTEKMLPEYDKLYRWLGKNGLFLYNHAAELHHAGKFEQSIEVFERGIRYFNDMDVQMLLADSYKNLEKYAEAELHLKTAAAMCPARFMPLYELVKLFRATDRKNDALALAQIILDKEVKIPSRTISAIKNEMRRFVEAEEESTGHTDNDTASEVSAKEATKPTVQSSETESGEAANNRLGANLNTASAVSASNEKFLQKTSVILLSEIADNRTKDFVNKTRSGTMPKELLPHGVARPP